MEILSEQIYWIVHTTRYLEVGTQVGLTFTKDDIHIMKKMFESTTNEIRGMVTEEGVITFLGVSFEKEDLNLPEGTRVRLIIAPTDIKLISADQSDIVLYLESLIYKGSYNEMLFYVEEQDDYLLVHSENEEEVGTDLGLKFDFDKIKVVEEKKK